MDDIDYNVYVEGQPVDELAVHVLNRTTDKAEAQLRVPTAHFTSQQRLAEEIALMKRLPLVVGHVREIKNAGDFITRDILETPLLIVRQADGSVATFRNMCRHRGGVVEPEACGNKRNFMCQYHGWTYDAEGGGLNPVFYQEVFGDIDYPNMGLHRIKTEVRHGMIFVTLTPDEKAEPIEEFIGPVDAQIEPWDFENSIIFLDKTFVRPINWKIVMDGTIDPVHPQFLHNKPGGVGERALSITCVFKTYGHHGKMYSARNRFKTLLETKDPSRPTTRHVASVMTLFPNSVFVNAPDHVEFWTVWPTVGKPGECTINIRFFARPGILNVEMEDRINRSWAVLEQAALDEDFPMEIAIQKNAEAMPDSFIIYGLAEKPPQHLHRELANYLGS